MLVGCGKPAMQTAPKPPSGAADASFDLTIDRLARLLPQAFEAIHWGYGPIRHDEKHLTVTALTPDGRSVAIVARPAENENTLRKTPSPSQGKGGGEGRMLNTAEPSPLTQPLPSRGEEVVIHTLTVHTRVGHFGDDALQQKFYDTLAEQVERFAGKELR